MIHAGKRWKRRKVLFAIGTFWRFSRRSRIRLSSPVINASSATSVAKQLASRDANLSRPAAADHVWYHFPKQNDDQDDTDGDTDELKKDIGESHESNRRRRSGWNVAT